MYNWTTKIRFVKTIGPVKATELKGIGIETVGDLLEYKPLDYMYPGVTAIKDLPSEGRVMIRARIEKIVRASNRPIVTAMLIDPNNDNDYCGATWWNQVFIVQHLRKGMIATFWGKVKNGILQQPKFSTIGTNEDVSGGLYGVHTETIRKALKEVMPNIDIPDWEDNKSVNEFMPRQVAFKLLHNPATKAGMINSVYRLKYDELLLMQLAVLKKKYNQQSKPPMLFGCKPITLGPKVRSYFPYKFTGGQEKVISEVITDICGDTPMNRLLHGEVGSGKTAVAFYAAMLTALNGKRAFILAPTTILAQQHYDTLKKMGWDDVILCNHSDKGGMPPLDYKGIVIGTHAILNLPHLKTASLVIVDEFQKFGVEQRAKLQRYGNPHVLLMSATPIPRSLAMTVFGDLDISTIRELPIKRGTVVTKWVLPDKREQMYEIIEEQLKVGKQIYIVYPKIGDEETVDSATKGYYEIERRFGKDNIIALLTGKCHNNVKSNYMRRFKSGDIKILVSTIIAEVGLDNPNASVMVVEGADRFGLSQLHQLRGRVCRSADTVFCFLVAETANDKSIARLNVMEKCNDGFEIAEHDLRLRGPGEMFSTRQHGLPDLKFASIVDDYELLIKARDTAVEIYDKLDSSEYAGLKEMLRIKYNETFKLAGVA